MIYNLPRKKKAASYPVKGDLNELDLDGQGAKDYRRKSSIKEIAGEKHADDK